MWQQARLIEHSPSDLSQIGERSLVPESLELFAHFSKQGFRPVAQAEQRFLATQSPACLGHCKHVLGCHSAGASISGVLPKRAIPAIVAAQVGQRYEDLPRVGD